tara:strand:+ start:226 stop:399 length:174 start_codon:yes stop_codon:yes gene_type:complete
MGLLIFGMGLSFLGEAIIMKYTKSPYWVIWGTAALTITNFGLCLFGNAVAIKAKMDN